jgi:hypothetical protein
VVGGGKALVTAGFEKLNPSASQARILILAGETSSSGPAALCWPSLYSSVFQDLSSGFLSQISGLPFKIKSARCIIVAGGDKIKDAGLLV